MWRLIALGLLFCTSPLAAQRLDPDWCLTCRDSREHLAAGAGIAVGARLILPKARTWQRLAVTGTIAFAWELGQAHSPHPSGPGYGFGPKDWLLAVIGACIVEYGWKVLR